VSFVLRVCTVCAMSVMVGTSWSVQAAGGLPDGPGKPLVQKICGGCHAPEIVLGRHETKEGWERIVSEMVDRGANGTDDEFNIVIDYLATNFPKEKTGDKATSTGKTAVQSFHQTTVD
jgi:hypothetical protein